jgi:hypothetical protein
VQLELVSQQLATERQVAVEKEAQIGQLCIMGARMEADLLAARGEESALREQLRQVGL